MLLRLLPSLEAGSNTDVVVRELASTLFCFGLLLMIWLAKFTSGQALGMIKPTPGDLGWAMVTAMGILILSVGTVRFLDSYGIEIQGAGASRALANRTPAILLMLVACTAISEEIIFRGILIPLITRAGANILVAGMISAVIFAAMHLHVWGLAKVFITIVPGVLFSLLFIMRGSLLSCILAHAIIDLIGLSGLIFMNKN
jgi:membrane protease YdiL (CAAX protease family)